MDLEGIQPGEDFVDLLERNLDGCEVLVVLIGKDWANAKNEYGERRLDDENDFVRIELRTALSRGIKVFPVLLDGAPPPRASELPTDLQPLVRRHAISLDYTSSRRHPSPGTRDQKVVDRPAGESNADTPNSTTSNTPSGHFSTPSIGLAARPSANGLAQTNAPSGKAGLLTDLTFTSGRGRPAVLVVRRHPRPLRPALHRQSDIPIFLSEPSDTPPVRYSVPGVCWYWNPVGIVVIAVDGSFPTASFEGRVTLTQVDLRPAALYSATANGDVMPPPAGTINQVEVAFAYVGPVGDGGWTFAHDNARKAVEKDFGDKINDQLRRERARGGRRRARVPRHGRARQQADLRHHLRLHGADAEGRRRPAGRQVRARDRLQDGGQHAHLRLPHLRGRVHGRRDRRRHDQDQHARRRRLDPDPRGDPQHQRFTLGAQR